MKKILLIIVVLVSCSCMIHMPVAEFSSYNNSTYDLNFLFEHDGCKVYRFYDMGNYVYFTNCTGEAISIKNDSTQSRVVNVVKSDVQK
jgi:hypothetical protein